jgi:hypothetical protein
MACAATADKLTEAAIRTDAKSLFICSLPEFCRPSRPDTIGTTYWSQSRLLLPQKRTKAGAVGLLSARSGQNERGRQLRRPRLARYKYLPGSGGPEPPAGAGGRLSGPPLPVPLPPFAFLTLLLEVLAGASAGPGCVAPCATLTFELEVVCGAFCTCVTIASAKRLAHIPDPRIRNDILGPPSNCRSTTAVNPSGAVFSSVISALGH